ncbi:MAG: Mth938-like domain-containing protein [Gammaproteobacteria bacterium]
MKIHLNDSSGGFAVESCGPGFVQINGARREQSFLLAPGGILPASLPSLAEELTGEHLQIAADIAPRPEVFLLGAGTHSPAHKIEWLAPFAKIGASLEIMSLPAACRTYNILQGDGRTVAAIFLL